MSLLNVENIQLAFGDHLILDNINFSLNNGDKIALVGKNGAGKTTLMKLLLGEVQLDDGELHYQTNTKIAYLEQEVDENLNGLIYDIVATGAGEINQLLSNYHHLLHQVASHPNNQNYRLLDEAQQQLEHANGWSIAQRIEQIISQMNLSADERIENLSGGLKRRVLLAKALVREPNILMLDEPTNHLDIEAILWLEKFVKHFAGCVLLISHDRTFMQNTASRYFDLDRGHLSVWDGNYQNYLRRKDEQLHAEEVGNKLFDKKLAQEEAWIRQGIKARRTRNEGRVRALEKMRQQFSERRKVSGKVKLNLDDHNNSGKIVAEIENLAYSYQDMPIIKDFSSVIFRGDRIGIIGPNGVGKSTLLKLLLGQLKPVQGKVNLGTKLQIGWFDQLRSQLEEDKTVFENIGEGKDYVTINQRQRHVYSYLRDFLFDAKRAKTPVNALSGGEKNRLLLARLFTRPTNLLGLDEPTNDLDADTLDLLENLLLNYEGTLLLVSHDRSFLDNVVTSTLVFEKNAIADKTTPAYCLNEYIGGYQDWLRQRPSESIDNTDKTNKNSASKSKIKSKKLKLSFNEKRELDELPKKIEKLEEKQEQLQQSMSQSSFYQQGSEFISSSVREAEQIEQQLELAYQRWEELEEKV